MDFLTNYFVDEIKESGKKIITKPFNKRRWEDIFVEAGNAVAEFENYYGDEQSEIRSIVFGRDNMILLADWLWEKDSFEFKQNLENCLDSLLGKSELLEENKENCKSHFMDIVIKETKEQFPVIAEQYLSKETYDMFSSRVECCKLMIGNCKKFYQKYNFCRLDQSQLIIRVKIAVKEGQELAGKVRNGCYPGVIKWIS